MERQTLLTLRHAAHVRTFSFDPSATSVLWIGPDGREGSDGAWACVEQTDGQTVLRALGGTRLREWGNGPDWTRLLALRDTTTMIRMEPAPDVAAALHVRPLEEGTACFTTYEVEEGLVLNVGRGARNELCYHNEFVSVRHARLSCSQESFEVQDLQSGNGTVVNGEVLDPLQPRRLRPGDVVQVLDLTIMVGTGLVCMNRPAGLVVRGGLRAITPGETDATTHDGEDGHADLPLFYPAPRLVRSASALTIDVDAPPVRRDEEPQPVLMQLGPSLLMGMSSVFMASNAIRSIAGGGDLMSSLPSLSMTVALLGGTIVWPIVSRAYERRAGAREEARIARRYAAYLDDVENRLLKAADVQARVLTESRMPVSDLLRMASESSPQLMSHARTHEDFLELRVGTGDMTVDAQVSWPQRSFSTADDMLWERVESLRDNPPLIKDVPLACNLARHPVMGLLGPRAVAWEFLRGLVVQICARYSYHEVKLVLLADDGERHEWGFLSSLGHLYEDGLDVRLVALTDEGSMRVDRLLEPVLDRRMGTGGDKADASSVHYVVLCASDSLGKRSKLVDRLLRCAPGMGFSIVYMGEHLSDLPRECGFLVDLTKETVREWNLGANQLLTEGATERRACMFERADVSATLVSFDPDILVTRKAARAFALDVAGLRLGSSDKAGAAPETVGFLEMFGVGSAAHLNVGQRWADSDPARTLATMIGMDAQGQGVMLDLHEKAHGPHGLVAGTTGSGKSEFIISYLLSLCVCYSPDEVSLVLIDYKGGGLAGAFESESMRLPHLAGTITNLDGSEVRRALVSIRSELKRRQRMFSRACEASGEATMDIHRYLTLCRQDVIGERLPHLVIVADEFAELKEQEPEFMDELISAARIGRSLGIHLILATQKPTGVVNDQIWANARFKVALKVSDAADSREMIRRDDAAHLSRPGAFYLLVGYDEWYVGGQAAYAGMPYEPKERFEPRRDLSVELLDGEGTTIAELSPPKTGVAANTDELHAVLEQVSLAAAAKGVVAQRLWLDPLPERISLGELQSRFGSMCQEGMACVVGLLDDPENQAQRPCVLDLAREGNVLLFGSSESGADELMRAMLVSLLDSSPREVWVYGWDGGSGALASIDGAPQVGGIVLGNDEERLGNLLRMLEEELVRRKATKAAQGEGELPQVVLALTNLPALLDLDDRIEDRLIPFTRDAPQQGMHVLATSSSTRAVPMRVQANFGVTFALRMRDEGDYSTLMGMTVDVVPPQRERRGIVREGKRVLEFLGASLGEDESEALEQMKAAWRRFEGRRARVIPVLPTRVTCEEMGMSPNSHHVPLGFSKESVRPIFADLDEAFSLLVVGNDRKALGSYVRGCCEALMETGARVALIDVGGSVGADSSFEVATTVDAAADQLRRMETEGLAVDVLVVANGVQTLERLPPGEAGILTTHITRGDSSHGPVVVMSVEAWQMASRYEDWARVMTSQGYGMWVGDGFADQSVLRYSRLQPAYRQAGSPHDGFVVRGAKVEGVRVLEPHAPQREGEEP